MKAILHGAGRGAAALFRNGWNYRRETGRSLVLWACLAALNFAVQIVFRRNLGPGEFGILNTLLAVIGLFLVPIVALRHAFAHFAPREHDPERRAAHAAGRLPLLEIATGIWACCVPLLLLAVLGLLGLPRRSLDFVTLAGALLALGGLAGASICEERKRRIFWGALLLTAALLRLLLAFGFVPTEPWAETGLMIGWAAALVLLAPVWRETRLDFHWGRARAVWRDREFARHAAATFSVWAGLFLFTNGDRIVAQAWFGRPQENNMGYVPWGVFDSYQAAGLLGRSLLWGTQPLLLLLLARRSGAATTTPGLRNLFWGYVGALFAGSFLLAWLARPLAALFDGTGDAMTVYFTSGFAGVMIPLGLLQGLGIFALASRRYPECHTLGVASLGYVVLLYVVGRPQLMLSYMFGGSTVALMVVLMVAVVRWGRSQP